MSSNKRTKVLVDCDTGVDDALALLLACSASSSGAIDLVGVTVVAGNGPVDVTLDATLRVLDAARAPASLGVARGFESPLLEKIHYAPFIHGTDCLGDLDPALPKSSRAVMEKHAVNALIDALETLREDEKLTIVALAPLTNVAVACKMQPKLFREKVQRVFWMGGAVQRGGNFNVWSEANAAYDPEAASIVFDAGVPITLYPWDCFMDVVFTEEELEKMGFKDRVGEQEGWMNTADELATRIMYREMRHWKKKTAVLGDAGALICLLDPESATTMPCSVRVELQGKYTRGMTAVDLRMFVDPPDLPKGPINADVVMKVDTERMKAVFARAVFGEERANLVFPQKEQK